jgi:hypothetical protein
MKTEIISFFNEYSIWIFSILVANMTALVIRYGIQILTIVVLRAISIFILASDRDTFTALRNNVFADIEKLPAVTFRFFIYSIFNALLWLSICIYY